MKRILLALLCLLSVVQLCACQTVFIVDTTDITADDLPSKKEEPVCEVAKVVEGEPIEKSRSDDQTQMAADEQILTVVTSSTQNTETSVPSETAAIQTTEPSSTTVPTETTAAAVDNTTAPITTTTPAVSETTEIHSSQAKQAPTPTESPVTTTEAPETTEAPTTEKHTVPPETTTVKYGSAGRLSIPDIGYSAALYDCSDADMYTKQIAVNNEDSACYIAFMDTAYIGDHGYQGFLSIKNAVPGVTVAVITQQDGRTEKYLCCKVDRNGTYKSSESYGSDGVELWSSGYDLFMVTCNTYTTDSITVAYWNRIS